MPAVSAMSMHPVADSFKNSVDCLQNVLPLNPKWLPQ